MWKTTARVRPGMPEMLENLLRACTVWVSSLGSDTTSGAGFFVAPGKVLTCAHVIDGVGWDELSIRWEQDGREPATFRVTSPPRVLPGGGRPITALAPDYPDIAVLEVDAPAGHPCVRLETGLPGQDDELQAYGYAEEGANVNFTPVVLGYRGMYGHEPAAFLDLRLDTVTAGMSGAALLNRRTRAVCGIIVATRNPERADGALAVPCQSVAEDLDDVLAANRVFHERDIAWKAAQSLWTVGSPYQGLKAFGEGAAPFFFGREDAVARVRGLMSDGRGLLMVSGASGVGKSSLLQAGVLPGLGGEGPESASWPRLIMMPGPAPLEALAVAAAPLLTREPAYAVLKMLKDDPAGFALAARQATRAQPAPGGSPGPRGAAGGRLLLIVDQFEQLFTQCQGEAERQAFITALTAAAAGRDGMPAALVVLGVRADFEDRCAAYPELARAVQDRYLVSPMTERQLRLAITGPARAAGAQVDDELTATLLAEVRTRQPGGAGVGVLPLLSHALDQAWRVRTGRDLTLADYERSGGIEEAVAASAERAYNALTSDQQEVARRIFIRLVATSTDGVDTAVRSTRAELVVGQGRAEAADVEAVLTAFVDERLLTVAADSAEISHDALISAWPRLRDGWLADNRSGRIMLVRLRDAAREWEHASRDPSYLYRGTLLQSATAAAENASANPTLHPPLSPAEHDFLAASIRSARPLARIRDALRPGNSTPILAQGKRDPEGPWSGDPRNPADNENPGLIFEMYVPSRRLYASEIDTFLSLFRSWLSGVRGYGIRQGGYETRTGKVYEFYLIDDSVRIDIDRERADFSDFLALCASDPGTATEKLINIGMERAEAAKFASDYRRRIERLSLDLKQEREQKLMEIWHEAESSLAGHYTERAIQDIRRIMETLIPDPSSGVYSSILGVGGQPLERAGAGITININSQVIDRVQGAVTQNVRGSANLSWQANQLLDLIGRYGHESAESLQTAVFEVEDKDAPIAKRRKARKRLQTFLGQVGGIARGVGVDLLQKYLESKIGL